MKISLITILLFGLTSFAFAQESPIDFAPIPGRTPVKPKPKAKASEIQFFPEVTTIFPLFVGAGIGVSIHDHYQIDVHYGVTPKPYYQVIGAVAAKLANDSTYNDVVQAAFQNNSLVRFSLQYNSRTVTKGMHMVLALSRMTASGQAGLDEVLHAATGGDYTNLAALLKAEGKSDSVEMDTTLYIADISGGYSWPLKNNFVLSGYAGILAVMDASVKLKTGLPNFEASPLGSALISSSEGDIEGIIGEYGISPVLGGSFAYMF